MKNKLLDIISKTKIQGLPRSIKCKYQDIYNFILDYQKQYNLKDFMESIYCIIHDIKERPKCKIYKQTICKGEDVKFKFEIGFHEYCPRCEHAYHTSLGSIKKYSDDEKKKEIIKKCEETCLQKYGVTSYNKLQDVKDKKKETLKEHFGELGLKHQDIYQKRIETNLKRYGVTHHLKCKEILEKREKDLFQKTGYKNVMQIPEIRKKLSDKWKEKRDRKFFDYIISVSKEYGYDIEINTYDNAQSKIKLKCQVCGKIIERLWNSFQQGGAVCEYCFPGYTGISKQQKDIEEFIRSNFPNLQIISNDKEILEGKHIDIFLPEKKIGIEYNGLWRHSSGGNVPSIVDKNYHLNKLEGCKKKEIRLISIFEDEWVLKKEIVKHLLLKSIGKNEVFKIRAENCIIRNVDYKTKREFISKYHLQGDRISQINIGLYYNNILVSMMTFSKYNREENKYKNCFELIRFCNNYDYQIYGSASKIIKFFMENYSDCDNLISYCDRRWSDGNTYYKCGFKLIDTTSPNYWYWGKGIIGRKHRLFANKFVKQYNQQENIIMNQLGYSWIYDCGNLKFLLARNF